MLTAVSQKGLPIKNGKCFNYLLVLLYVYVICFGGKGSYGHSGNYIINYACQDVMWPKVIGNS